MLLTALIGSAPAGAGNISPTGISVVAQTDNSGLAGAPAQAVPTVLAAVGDSISLAVTLTPQGAAFNQDTALSATLSLASGAKPAGQLTVLTPLVMPSGQNTATFKVSYSAVDNGVQVTLQPAKLTGSTRGVAPGSTQFDVQKTLKTFPGGTDPVTTSVGNNDCTQATTEPECGTVVLQHGVNSAQGALSLGACTDTGCRPGGQDVQFIADLGGRYTSTDPATLIVRCNKSVCSGGGVSSYPVNVSLSATGPLSPSPACAAKGVVDAGLLYCTDYVQSHRDNAGDLLMYVLFIQDMRGSM